MGEIRGSELLHRRAFEAWAAEATVSDASMSYVMAERGRVSAGRPNDGRTPKRAVNWVQTLHRYEDFWGVNGRSPRENTRNRDDLPDNERRMGEWARYQRRFSSRLTAYQVIRLDVSPAFQWEPQDAAWRLRLEECVAHVSATGQLPYLSSRSGAEFALARWLGRQLRDRRAGVLTEDRDKLLRDFLSGTRVGDPVAPAHGAVAVFEQTHGRGEEPTTRPSTARTGG